MPLYGLVFGIPDQKEIIDKHCLGDCGEIILGAVDGGDDIGSLMVCREPKEKCPHFDKEIDTPIGTVDDEEIYIRKLK
jgi:hypothetical protein